MRVNFSAIPTSQILCSSEDAGYRDPAAVIHDGRMYCYYSYVERSDDGFTDFHLGLSVSEDLIHWEGPILLTERDRSKNWSSPGCVLRVGDEWAMCLQTYPTLGNAPGRIFGNGDSRIYLSRSRDLLHWSEPELLRVHGDDVPPEAMGRMIDPYIVREQGDSGRYLVFYKQHPKGVPHRVTATGYPVEYMSFSSSVDLRHFRFEGSVECSENVCILPCGGEYRIYNSPQNGIACLRTRDFQHFVSDPLLTLGQAHWPWAQSRLTAGFVLDARAEPGVGKYLMLFHGDQPAFPLCASIGLAWSDDCAHWQYAP